MAITVTEWLAASNKWKQNLNSTTSPSATSLGTGNNGLNGTDIAYPIQLSSTRWLWVFGDSFWPTAAGQVRGGSKFVGNVAALQVGADFSTCTLTFYCGPPPGTTTVSNTNPWPFFEHNAPRFSPQDVSHGMPGLVKYPMAGARVSTDAVLVVGMYHQGNLFGSDLPLRAGPPPLFGFQDPWAGVGGSAGSYPVGPWAELLWSTSLDSTTPDTWAHQDVEIDLPRSWGGIGQRQSMTLQHGVEIVGDHVVIWGGTWDQSGHWSVCRYPLSEVLSGIMRAPEWWAGGERWVADRPNAQRRIRITPQGMTAEQGGAVFKRTDGRYQLCTVPERFYDPAADPTVKKQGTAHVSISIAREPGAAFDRLTDIYEIPIVIDDYDFRYGAYMAQGQTWSGRPSVNDQVMLYSTNSSNPAGLSGPVFTDARCYWPKMVQVTGI